MTRLLTIALIAFLMIGTPFVAEAQAIKTVSAGGINPAPTVPGYKPASPDACNKARANPTISYLEDMVPVNITKNTFNINSTGSVICPCVPEPGLWIERVVYCFGSAPDGMIFNITQGLIRGITPYFWSIYAPLILLSMVMFGWKLGLGMLRDLKQETFTYAFKLVCVLTFLAWFPLIHGWSLQITQELANIPADALKQFVNMCNGSTTVSNPNLWAQWDCAFGHLLGASVVDKSKTFVGSPAMLSLTSILGAYVTTWGFGTVITMAGAYVIMTLIFTAMRMVTSYLLAIIAVSFLMLIGPLFVPLILFQSTNKMFSTWVQSLLAYMIQPMLIVMFMGIMLVTFQYAVFIGPSSLVGIITNTSPTVPEPPGKPLFGNLGAGKDLTTEYSTKKIEVGRMYTDPEIVTAKPGVNANSLQYNNPRGELGMGGKVAIAPNVPKARASVAIVEERLSKDPAKDAAI